MKLKALLLACVLAGFTASFALADDGGGHHGRGDHHGTRNEHAAQTTTPAGCMQLELQGTLASVASTSFTLTVTRQEVGDDEDNDNDDDDDNAANPAAPNLVGQTVTIAVDPNARVTVMNVGTLSGPAVGDFARVDALSCGSPAILTAQSVKTRSAKAPMRPARHH